MVCFGAVLFDDLNESFHGQTRPVSAHNPVDDARGNAEALRKFKELGLAAC